MESIQSKFSVREIVSHLAIFKGELYHSDRNDEPET